MTKIGQGLCVLALVVWYGSRKSDAPAPVPSMSAESSAAVNGDARAHTDAAPLQKAEEVSASRIIAEFDNNEAAAEDRYKGRCLVLTGTVKSVDAGIGKDPTLQLAGGLLGILVNDVPREWAKKLNRNDSVAVDVDGIGEIVGTPVATYSAACGRKREAFETAAANAAAARAAAAPPKVKSRAKPGGTQAKN